MTAFPKQIGPYTITREIGRGGMGVVYLARDTTLDRDVAIKALPPELADDADRLARFEREAKALASLNHPNIASIYGLEEVGGQRYLILEYVPGDTLDQALDHGPMPVSEALPVAKQIAEAIESAHEHGIIHRDLKPANIKFASADKVKVLDFGLAKAFETESSTTSEAAASPTYIPTNTPTMPGVVLGTAGYLSPEQARGRPVDKRSDIFSFGCVLFEMLAGKTIFAGETVADSLGATLHKDPNWDELPADTPPTILLLLRRCLTKDRKRRLHDIADARVEIEDAISDPTSSSLNLATAALAAAGAKGTRQSQAKVGIALVIGALLTATATFLPDLLTPDETPLVTRLSLVVPNQSSFFFSQRLAVSPDGRTIAVMGTDDDDEPRVFLRHLGQSEWTPLEGLGNVIDFAFSPDGQWIVGRNSEVLRRISIDGGPPTTLCDTGFGMGIFWAPDGWIYYSDFSTSGISRVPENGGDPQVVAEIENKDNEPRQNLIAPQVLPDGSTLLCQLFPFASVGRSEIRAYSLVDSSMKTIVENASHSHYTPTGHLLFMRESNLMAAPFDVETLELRGPAVSLVEEITTTVFTQKGIFALAENGTLFHSSGEMVKEVENILALDTEGKRSLLVSFARTNLSDLRSSLDGSHLAVTVTGIEGVFKQDIWLLDVNRDIPALLTTEPGNQHDPLWSPDGRWVYYWSGPSGDNRDVKKGVYRRRADFGGEAELVYETERFLNLKCFNPEGTRIFVVDRTGNDQRDLSFIDLEGEVTLEPWLATPAMETQISVSPNGRWVSYLSNETGRFELYVRSITGEQKQRLSTEGASGEPFWSPDGSTLHYHIQNGQDFALNAIKVTSGSEIAEEGVEPSDEPFDWEPAKILFELEGPRFSVHMHPDGQRFIMIGFPEETETVDSFEIHVTLNFFEELKQRASTEF